MATKKNTTVSSNGKEYEYFRITRTVGHEWKDGKKIPIKKQFTGTSKGNAQKKYEEWKEAQVKDQLDKVQQTEEKQHRTFGELAEEYTYNVLMNSRYKTGTKNRYEQSYRVHVKESFLKSIPICEVEALTIQDYYQSIDVSMQTLKAINKWMAAFYKWLCLNKYSSDILPAVTLPEKKDNKQHNDIVAWEPDEIHTILTSSCSFRHHFMILVMNYAGLRISECLGLKYSDFKDNVLSINRQYYQREITAPKHDSYRKIPLHQEIIKGLAAHKEWHEREMIRNGYETEYVFTTNTGRLLDYGNIRRAFIRFYARNDIEAKKFHAYRATFCTELCRQGVPLEVASKLMGHKSIEVTAAHYALVKQDVKEAAIATLPGISSEPTNSFRVVKPTRKPRRIK